MSKRRKFGDEFKREAVGLTRQRRAQPSHGARAIDVGAGVPWRWRRELEADKSAVERPRATCAPWGGDAAATRQGLMTQVGSSALRLARVRDVVRPRGARSRPSSDFQVLAELRYRITAVVKRQTR